MLCHSSPHATQVALCKSKQRKLENTKTGNWMAPLEGVKKRQKQKEILHQTWKLWWTTRGSSRTYIRERWLWQGEEEEEKEARERRWVSSEDVKFLPTNFFGEVDSGRGSWKIRPNNPYFFGSDWKLLHARHTLEKPLPLYSWRPRIHKSHIECISLSRSKIQYLSLLSLSK